jgi:hypothetical protein
LTIYLNRSILLSNEVKFRFVLNPQTPDYEIINFFLILNLHDTEVVICIILHNVVLLKRVDGLNHYLSIRYKY